MSPLTFDSCLAAPIRRLIELRQVEGSDYQTQARLLLYFDRFLVARKWAETRLTREAVEAYERTLSGLAPRGRANRMGVLRQLCAYLSRSDPLTYLPEPGRTPSSKTAFAPYIYSEQEVCALLTTAARLPPPDTLRGPTYQTLLGLLYSTGLRIGEAMALKLDNFHRDTARLFIAQGKFRKARWVPLSDSTAKVLACYVDRRRHIPPCSPESPLFLNQRGCHLHHCTVNQCFHCLLEQCGIAGGGHAKPRLHDLRHTFAVHRLLAWYHDPCKTGRRGGAFEEPRDVLRAMDADFVEMPASREYNWCCGGGAAVFLLQRATPLRDKAFKIKIEQVESTGADTVVVSCWLNFEAGRVKNRWGKTWTACWNW